MGRPSPREEIWGSGGLGSNLIQFFLADLSQYPLEMARNGGSSKYVNFKY